MSVVPLTEPDRTAGPATPAGPAVVARPRRDRGRRPKARNGMWRRRLRRDWPHLVMVAPAIVLFLLFTYIPLAGNIIAFQEYSPFRGITGSPWVGFAQFERLFGSPDFWRAVVNTLSITAIQLILFFPVPILLALLLNSLISERVKNFVQSVIYLPHFMSWVIVVTFFQQMLGGAGLVNRILADNGVAPIDVMTNPELFKLLVTAQAIWKDAGWGTIIFLAALSTINVGLYEAAAADGAGPWRRTWHVTLPGLRPVIVLLLILRLGDALTVGFEQILLQRDAVGRDAAEVIDTFVYFNGIVAQDWGLGAAANLAKGVIGLILVLAANKVAHALGEQGVYTKR